MGDPEELDPERAARVLARAIELSRQSPEGRSRGPYRKLTLRELERAAAEVGIDPAHVQRAAVEAGEAPSAPSQRAARLWLGGPTSFSAEIELPVRIEEEDHEEIAATIRERLGEVGAFNVLGRSLAWSPMMQAYRPTQIEVRAGAASTRIVVKESFGGAIGGLYGGLVGGGGFGLGGGAAGVIGGALKAPGAGIAAMFVLILASLLIARIALSRITAQREAALRDLAQSLRETITACAERRPGRVRVAAEAEAKRDDDRARAEHESEAESEAAVVSVGRKQPR